MRPASALQNGSHAKRAPCIHGIVHSEGPFALGSACAAPIVEIRNTLLTPVVVFYESLVDPMESALTNRQVVPAKSYCLLTGLHPSSRDLASKIRVEDMTGNFDSFLLRHHSTRGYEIECVCLDAVPPGHLRRCKPARLALGRASDPYVLDATCNEAADWRNDVIVPLKITSMNSVRKSGKGISPIDGDSCLSRRLKTLAPIGELLSFPPNKEISDESLL